MQSDRTDLKIFSGGYGWVILSVNIMIQKMKKGVAKILFIRVCDVKRFRWMIKWTKYFTSPLHEIWGQSL